MAVKSPSNMTSAASSASRAVSCLEDAWRQLRLLDPRIPPAVLVPLSAGDRRRKRGHFSPSAWRPFHNSSRVHEVGISPDMLSSPADVLATLLHEAAHAILYETDCAGGVTGRYYHTTSFRDVCAVLGLECRFKHTRYGWSITRWPLSGIPARYESVLEILAKLPIGTTNWRAPASNGRSLPARGLWRLACRCEQPRTIQASKSVALSGGILCSRCGAEFRFSPNRAP